MSLTGSSINFLERCQGWSPPMKAYIGALLRRIKEKSACAGRVEVSFPSPAEMYTLNLKYRGKAKVTDILSFPSTMNAQEARSLVSNDEHLGHIVMSLETIKRRCRNRNLKLHLQRLLVHGFAHLLHYDHHRKQDYLRMRSFESFLQCLISQKGFHQSEWPIPIYMIYGY